MGSLDALEIDWDSDAETGRDEIEGWVPGLLRLVGIDADPISSREHILIANPIERSWRAGKSLDLAALLGQIQRPPLHKLGVFEVDDFFPPKRGPLLGAHGYGRASSARWRQVTRSKEQRLVTAQEQAMDKCNVIATIEQDLTDEVAELNDTWEVVSLEIEEVEIGLEKTDISVDDFVLVWIPTKID